MGYTVEPFIVLIFNFTLEFTKHYFHKLFPNSIAGVAFIILFIKRNGRKVYYEEVTKLTMVAKNNLCFP